MQEENSILEDIKHFINSHETFKLSELRGVIKTDVTLKDMFAITNMLKNKGIIEVLHKDSFKVIANMKISNINVEIDEGEDNKTNLWDVPKAPVVEDTRSLLEVLSELKPEYKLSSEQMRELVSVFKKLGDKCGLFKLIHRRETDLGDDWTGCELEFNVNGQDYYKTKFTYNCYSGSGTVISRIPDQVILYRQAIGMLRICITGKLSDNSIFFTFIKNHCSNCITFDKDGCLLKNQHNIGYDHCLDFDKQSKEFYRNVIELIY